MQTGVVVREKRSRSRRPLKRDEEDNVKRLFQSVRTVCARDRGPYVLKNACRQSEKSKQGTKSHPVKCMSGLWALIFLWTWVVRKKHFFGFEKWKNYGFNIFQYEGHDSWHTRTSWVCYRCTKFWANFDHFRGFIGANSSLSKIRLVTKTCQG